MKCYCLIKQEEENCPKDTSPALHASAPRGAALTWRVRAKPGASEPVPSLGAVGADPQGTAQGPVLPKPRHPGSSLLSRRPLPGCSGPQRGETGFREPRCPRKGVRLEMGSASGPGTPRLPQSLACTERNHLPAPPPAPPPPFTQRSTRSFTEALSSTRKLLGLKAGQASIWVL